MLLIISTVSGVVIGSFTTALILYRRLSQIKVREPLLEDNELQDIEKFFRQYESEMTPVKPIDANSKLILLSIQNMEQLLAQARETLRLRREVMQATGMVSSYEALESDQQE